ncbi:MAG: DUF3159 domain-containing protein [Halanaerobiales bacterium]|nr:DUF3159 domain-containing protein [Halanaerobiales bacterium]
MNNKVKEIISELKLVISSKTIDSIIPPIVFLISNTLYNIQIAAINAVLFIIIIGIIRLIKKQTIKYALGGLGLVLVASTLAYITKSAAGYFIPAIINSSILLLISLISNLLGKPLAAWASHLTRGWPIEWFWRKDVKPAYREVTWFWTALLLLRLILQLILYNLGGQGQLTWINLILGWPFTITVLILSYVYGIWRLKNLDGPSVDEFKNNDEPPWRGQTKGF